MNEKHIQKLYEVLNDGKKLRHLSEYLTVFWNQFDIEACAECSAARHKSGKGVCLGQCRDREFKTRLLVAMAEIVFFAPGYDKRLERREKFNVDYAKSRVLKCECFLCGGEGHHRHHIIQLQHGGKICAVIS